MRDGWRRTIIINRFSPFPFYRYRSSFFFAFGYPYAFPYLFPYYGGFGYGPFFPYFPYFYGYDCGVPYATYVSYAPTYYSTYGAVDGSTAGAADNALAQAGQPAPDSVGYQYLAEAELAFREGEYRQAVRMASHAAIELPEEASVHAVLWLSLFALGDYQGSAVAAHAMLHYGGKPTWKNVQGYYAQAADFTPHLRALEAYVRNNPESPFGTFLLGLMYQVLGHNQHAKTRLEKALQLAPEDVIAQKLYESVGGDLKALPKPVPQANPPVPEPAPAPAQSSSHEAGELPAIAPRAVAVK